MVFAFCVESLPDSADLRKDDVKRRRHSDSDASIRLATALSRNVKPSLLFLFKKRKECIIISIFLYDLFLCRLIKFKTALSKVDREKKECSREDDKHQQS